MQVFFVLLLLPSISQVRFLEKNKDPNMQSNDIIHMCISLVYIVLHSNNGIDKLK